ncbi:hypothetical protein EYF80_000508 [Liparis tanakae]|uniref:Uncharacterized protein n=1 Tax=Liparis tanakae TaxID=230148 RepID=A0A4Z2JGA0_9TELE|nr:hypothetical protein EYF80_000508 [Liparis tanakae]
MIASWFVDLFYALHAEFSNVLSARLCYDSRRLNCFLDPSLLGQSDSAPAQAPQGGAAVLLGIPRPLLMSPWPDETDR